MSGTTTNGWPYVTPDDHPKEYPAASQALAQMIDSSEGLTDQIISAFGPGWSVPTGQLRVIGRAHGSATLVGIMNRQSGTDTVMLPAGTIPAALRPKYSLEIPMYAIGGANAAVPVAAAVIATDGSVGLARHAGVTTDPTTWFQLACTWTTT